MTERAILVLDDFNKRPRKTLNYIFRKFYVENALE